MPHRCVIVSFLCCMNHVLINIPSAAPFSTDIFTLSLHDALPILVVLYVFMFRSKKNQDRKKQSMLNEMKRGDRVQTIGGIDRKSTRLNSSHLVISYAVFCLKKKILFNITNPFHCRICMINI